MFLLSVCSLLLLLLKSHLLSFKHSQVNLCASPRVCFELLLFETEELGSQFAALLQVLRCFHTLFCFLLKSEVSNLIAFRLLTVKASVLTLSANELPERKIVHFLCLAFQFLVILKLAFQSKMTYLLLFSPPLTQFSLISS